MTTMRTKSEWKTKPLGEVARIERQTVAADQIPSGSTYVGLEHITSAGSFVGVKEVASGELASTKFRFTDEHVLYGKLRPYLSKIARPSFDGICSTDIVPILAGGELDRGFLYYFLRQPYMVELATSRTIGANLPRLSPKQLAAFRIPLPPRPEQKRIADILDKADAIRRKRQECGENLRAFPASLFERLFGDPISNPKSWDTSTLDEVITLQGGFAFKSADYSETGVPLIRIGNANNQRFSLESLVYLPETFAKEYDKFLLSPGDMIMTLTGTVGKDDYANLITVPHLYDRWFLNQRVARVRIQTPRVLGEYLVQYLMHPSIKRQIRRMNRGVRQANLSNSDILSQVVSIPPLSLQQSFSEQVAKADELHKTTNKAAGLDSDLFNSLVQRAFRGEL